jgi:ATP-dependent Zn protease
MVRRRKYLSLRMGEGAGNRIDDSTLDLMSEKSAGMSIANLEQVIEAAGRAAARKDTPITAEMLLEALDTAREGEAKEWSPQFLESTARHEAGHTVMYWLAGWWSPEVSIVARAHHGGGMRRAEEEMKRESLTREELLANIRVCLGGRAAEVLCYGPDAGLTTGASGDLKHATSIARQMICRYGMTEEFGLLAAPELLQQAEALGSPLYEQVSRLAARVLKEQMEQTLELLAEQRQELDSIARELLKRNRLYRKELQDLLPPLPVR